MNDVEKMFSHITLFKLDTPLNNARTNALYKKLGYVQTNIEGDCVSYVKKCNKLDN